MTLTRLRMYFRDLRAMHRSSLRIQDLAVKHSAIVIVLVPSRLCRPRHFLLKLWVQFIRSDFEQAKTHGGLESPKLDRLQRYKGSP